MRQAFEKFTKSQDSYSAYQRTVSLLKSQELLWIDEAEFDADPWLTNTPYGTIDLHTTTWAVDKKGNDLTTPLCRLSTKCEFNPKATYDEWTRFHELVQPDPPPVHTTASRHVADW
jgi:phage/plasmid-associated DNA primase